MKMHASCVARHSGLWAVDARWFSQTWACIKAGAIRAMEPDEAERRSSVPVHVTEDGIAVVSINGPMLKGASKFGNANSVEARSVVRAAAGDTNVRAMLLKIDSPGGTVAGTDDLATDVAAANKVKPVYAQIEDLGASAAYWVASQAGSVFAGPTSEVGSIGVYAVVEDSSKAAEMDGIKVHVVSSGGMKGAFADGTPITDDQLAYLQQQVDRSNGFFVDAIRRGRGMSESKAAKVTTGETWYAQEAFDLGLIDGVQRLDETLTMIRKDLKGRDAAARAKRQVAVMRTR